jgi:predicted TIM-barrel fold metal-dependent hydrolase
MHYSSISADGHINEPPDLWTSRLPAKFKERGPHVIETPNTHGHAWMMEGQQRPAPLGLTSIFLRSSKRFERASIVDGLRQTKDRGVRFEDVFPGSFDPKARVTEMLEDKIEAEVMFNGLNPWPGIKFCHDHDLSLACFKAYNDWIAEFQAYAPERFVCNGTLPTTGIDDCVAELYRCAELGLRTVQLESYPNGSYSELTKEDDRFWAAAVETGMVINQHAGFFLPVGDLGGRQWQNSSARQNQAKNLGVDLLAGAFPTILFTVISGGVFERFPALTFVGTEVFVGWVPYWLERFDESARRNRAWQEWDLPLLPSEYFERNVSLAYIIDEAGVDDANRYSMGVGKILWGPDFPHSASSWPLDYDLGLEFLKRAGCTPAEIERIMWRNAADLYKIPYDEPSPLTTAA